MYHKPEKFDFEKFGRTNVFFFFFFDFLDLTFDDWFATSSPFPSISLLAPPMARDSKKSRSNTKFLQTNQSIIDTKNARYIKLYQLLLHIFKGDKNTLFVPRLPKLASEFVNPSDIYTLIDLSNIFIGFQKAVYENYPKSLGKVASIKMDMEALDLILQRGRTFVSKSVCGSYPKKNMSMTYVYHAMFDQCRSIGYEVTVMDRVSRQEEGEGAKEHGVDEMLSFQILGIILSNKKTPGTLVLTTGDGQMSSLAGTMGFYPAVEKALANGWRVELYSFGGSLSQNWIRLRDSVGSSERFRIIYLDEFVEVLHQKEFSSFV